MAEIETNPGAPAGDICGRCGQPGMAHVVHECKSEALPVTARTYENPIEARLQAQLDMLFQRVEALEKSTGAMRRQPSAS